MRLPSILDLLNAVSRIALTHPAVRAWWLTPRARLPLKGAATDASTRVIDLAVERAADGSPDCGLIERDLSKLLPGTLIQVHVLRPEEGQGMLRLLSAPHRGQS